MDLQHRTEVMMRPVFSFEEKFPELEDVLIEAYQSSGPSEFDEKNLHGQFSLKDQWPYEGARFRCSNRLCQRGGFDLGPMIEQTAGQKHTSKSASIRCEGDEGSRLGRRRGRPCTNELHCRVTILYKD
jgi:hypothetical protein